MDESWKNNSEIRIAWNCAWSALELEVLRCLSLAWVIRWVRFGASLRYRRAIQFRQKQLRVLFPGAAPDKIRDWAREGIIHHRLRGRLNFLFWRHDAYDFREQIAIEGWQHIDESIQQGRGAVLLATHIGLPRILRWYFRATDICVYYLVRMEFPRNTGVFQWFDDRLRRRHGVDTEGVIGSGELSLQWMKKAHDALRRNGLVYITGDGGRRGRRVSVPICGQEISIATGGFSLGLLAGAPILPCFSHLDSRTQRFHIQIQAPLPTPPPSMTQVQRLNFLATTYAARIEDYIARNPKYVWDTFLPREE